MRRMQSLGFGLLAFAALSAAVVLPLPVTALITVGALETPGHGLARHIEIVGGLAYVAGYGSGQRVIDVSDPACAAGQAFLPPPERPNQETDS